MRKRRLIYQYLLDRDHRSQGKLYQLRPSVEHEGSTNMRCSRILLPRFLRKLIMKKLLALAFACFSAGFTNLAAAESEDAMFDKVAEEYIQGYLSARPLQATRLGFHQYDGKINDYSRLAIDAEIARLQRFADRLQKFDATKLGPRASIDLRILLAAIRGDLFNIQDMAVFERNPMTYAPASTLISTSSATSRRSKTVCAASSPSRARPRTS